MSWTMSPKLHLGALEIPEDTRDLLFRDYAKPKVPAVFGHEDLVPNWGMLGNDEAGDCVLAGGGHETELWTAAGGAPALFSTANTLADYSALTGYNPNAGPPDNNPTDQGTDPREAAKYRQSTGLADATGQRHKIGAYLFLNPGDPKELAQALYLFEAVGLCFAMQQAQMDQFNAGKPWDYVPGSPDVGGHYVPGVQRKQRNTIDVVSWSKLEPITPRFVKHRCTAALVYVSEEMLKGGVSLEGFNAQQLADDLAHMQGTQ